MCFFTCHSFYKIFKWAKYLKFLNCMMYCGLLTLILVNIERFDNFLYHEGLQGDNLGLLGFAYGLLRPRFAVLKSKSWTWLGLDDTAGFDLQSSFLVYILKRKTSKVILLVSKLSVLSLTNCTKKRPACTYWHYLL